ncbi:RAM signaling network component [Elasticomyces elasticus]|nr:RAM signaling network component [Elasticomyces elasticus]
MATAVDPDLSQLADLLAFTKKVLEAEEQRNAAYGKPSEHGPADLEPINYEAVLKAGITLDLSQVNISALPVEVIDVISRKVERLALSHNHQIFLPPQFAQCARLRYLNIRWNQLKTVPDVIFQLPALEILDLSKNKITTIPNSIKNLTSLRFLAMSRNRIEKLPVCIGTMTNLMKLKIEDNPLSFPPPSVWAFDPGDESLTEGERDRIVCMRVQRFMRQRLVERNGLNAGLGSDEDAR